MNNLDAFENQFVDTNDYGFEEENMMQNQVKNVTKTSKAVGFGGLPIEENKQWTPAKNTFGAAPSQKVSQKRGGWRPVQTVEVTTIETASNESIVRNVASMDVRTEVKPIMVSPEDNGITDNCTYGSLPRIKEDVLKSHPEKILEVFIKTLNGEDRLCSKATQTTPEKALEIMLIRGTIPEDLYESLRKKRSVKDMIEAITGCKSVYDIVQEEGEDAIKNIVTDEEIDVLRASASRKDDFNEFFVESVLPLLIKYDEERKLDVTWGDKESNISRRQQQYLLKFISVYVPEPKEALIKYFEFIKAKERHCTPRGLAVHLDKMAREQKAAK